MEQTVTSPAGAIYSHRGFILVTVLIITAVGLLFGAGALLLFRYQCQMRIDRQHELEKVYAVRSALNFITMQAAKIPDSGKQFGYHTESERDLGLFVKPVDPIFPDKKHPEKNHFAMEDGHFRYPCQKQYDRVRDYEYGAIGVTNVVSGFDKVNKDGRRGLMFRDSVATNGVKWWVNVGMRGTGGWLQEDYGRRYYFIPQSILGNDAEHLGDVVRLCLVRNVTNQFNAAGRRHGWPLSQEGERAIVLQVGTVKGVLGNNGIMTLSELVYTGGSVVGTERICVTNFPPLSYVGLQLADDKVSVFHIENIASGAIELSDSGGYTFSEVKELNPDTLRYFAEEVFVGGVSYGGTNTVDGELRSPELRAVFEIEAASDMRTGSKLNEEIENDFLTNFKVTPAYQFDVYIEHPAMVTNLATVAQRIGDSSRTGPGYTTLTYDTHGTEHKGFRRDEREYERGRGR